VPLFPLNPAAPAAVTADNFSAEAVGVAPGHGSRHKQRGGKLCVGPLLPQVQRAAVPAESGCPKLLPLLVVAVLKLLASPRHSRRHQQRWDQLCVGPLLHKRHCRCPSRRRNGKRLDFCEDDGALTDTCKPGSKALVCIKPLAKLPAGRAGGGHPSAAGPTAVKDVRRGVCLPTAQKPPLALGTGTSTAQRMATNSLVGMHRGEGRILQLSGSCQAAVAMLQLRQACLVSP
jgi:hypothetical protein